MLELNHGYCIESDENQFILRQYYIGKTKDGEPKEAVRTIGYYAKLQQALEDTSTNWH